MGGRGTTGPAASSLSGPPISLILSRFGCLTAYQPTTAQEPCIASCDLRQNLDRVQQLLVFDIDFQRACQRCRVFRKHFHSVIAFTDRKLRSHWPSVTPSARVLVRFPLHVILSVEAAFRDGGAEAIGLHAVPISFSKPRF